MSGDNQVGATAKALANPFVVVVTNAGGIPVAGVDVTFTITADGGTLPGGSPQLVVTDSWGVASTTLSLGATAEANTVTATATGLAGSPVTFTATARLATTLSMVSGDTQSDTAGTALANPFVVKVIDGSSNPVPGVTVTFAVTLGGGSLSATSVTTNALGQASSLLTLGTGPESNTVTATAAGLTGSPLTFTATGLNKGRSQLISD